MKPKNIVYHGIRLSKIDSTIIDNVKRLYLEGYTTWEVASIVGIDQSKTRRILRATNTPIRPKSSPRKSYGKYKRVGEILPTTMARLHESAKNRKLSVEITAEYLWDLFLVQNRKCALSGLDIEFAKTWRESAHGNTTASLDRIDSTKDYIEGNVQWVHKDINRMKSNFSETYFFELCKTIIKYQEI